MKNFFHKFSTILTLDLELFCRIFSRFIRSLSPSKSSASNVCCMHPIMLFPHELKDEFQGHEKCVDDDKCGEESKRNQVNTVNNVTSTRAEILLQFLFLKFFLTTYHWNCPFLPCYLIPFSSSASFFLFFPNPILLECSFLSQSDSPRMFFSFPIRLSSNVLFLPTPILLESSFPSHSDSPRKFFSICHNSSSFLDFNLESCKSIDTWQTQCSLTSLLSSSDKSIERVFSYRKWEIRTSMLLTFETFLLLENYILDLYWICFDEIWLK